MFHFAAAFVVVTVLTAVVVVVVPLLTVLVTVVLAGPLVIRHEHADETPALPRPSEIPMPPGKPIEMLS